MGRGSVLPTSPLRLQTLEEAAKCRQTRLLPLLKFGSRGAFPGVVPFSNPWAFGREACLCRHIARVNWTPVETGEGTRDALVLRPQFRDGRPPCSAERLSLS